jgi:hypothetical protein
MDAIFTLFSVALLIWLFVGLVALPVVGEFFRRYREEQEQDDDGGAI